MVRTNCSSREIASVLLAHGFVQSGRVWSHLKLRYESPDTEEVRIVTVPMQSADDIPTGTLQSIAQQCGANDFHAWCQWIEQSL